MTAILLDLSFKLEDLPDLPWTVSDMEIAGQKYVDLNFKKSV
jgi:hypothetical protein